MKGGHKQRRQEKPLYVGKKENGGKVIGYGKYATKKLGWVAKNDIEYFKKIKELYYSKFDFVTKHLYDRLYKKFLKNEDLYLDKKQEIVSSIIEQKKFDNKNFYLIKPILQERYKGISLALIEQCIIEAKATLSKEFEIEREFIVDIHTLRYEELYATSLDPDLSNVPLMFHDSALTESYSTAIDILFQKERALGLHSKMFKVQINNYLQTKNKKSNNGLNFNSLTLDEQITLLQLVEDSRVSDVIYRPIIKNESDNIKVNKVEVIQQIEAPIRAAKQTDVIGDESKAIVKQQGKSLIDIKETMRENLKKQVEEAFKKQKK